MEESQLVPYAASSRNSLGGPFSEGLRLQLSGEAMLVMSVSETYAQERARVLRLVSSNPVKLYKSGLVGIQQHSGSSSPRLDQVRHRFPAGRR